ncbi:uncharacterized protein PG986_009971 [Apiospora aurea]|uniref:Uncharacterized protein n=1 Tax=Apiospora aurea TaxID=335848 RepID=A0ABR1Q978_9PEZI
MSTETFSVLEKPEDGSEVRRQQAQSDPTPLCTAAIVEAAAPTHAALAPGSTSAQTNGNRLSYRSSLRVPFSHHLSVIQTSLQNAGNLSGKMGSFKTTGKRLWPR